MMAGMAVAVMLILLSIYMTVRKSSVSQKIMDFRKQKNHYFRTSIDSPIPDKENFPGLNYYPPDDKYKVSANLIILRDSIPLIIKRNDGKEESYVRFAKAYFTIENKQFSLALLKLINNPLNENILFIPFADKTNGVETYSGGRYMDVKFKSDKKIALDFNLAYNPYCSYNYKFSCPLPPQENYLDIEIRAGEKIFVNNE
jgi:uncharacterized protein (DUF1684 family)